jgi:hypothetical protein
LSTQRKNFSLGSGRQVLKSRSLVCLKTGSMLKTCNNMNRNGYKTKLNLSSRCCWESSVRFLRPEEPIRSSKRKTFFLMKYDRSNQWDPVDSPYRLSALDTILLSDWPTPMKYDRVILFSLRCRWRMGIPGNDSENGNPFIHPTGINFLQWLDNENRAKPDFWVIN